MFKQSIHHPNILSLIDKRSDGCWLWKGYIDPRYGYGRYGAKGNRAQAHRLIYELLKGQVPKNLGLDHLCRVRHCVNPSHLEPVSCRINLLRGKTKAAENAAKTHCSKGHLLNPENLVAFVRGRNCLICKRERNKLWMRNYKPKEKSNGHETTAAH